MHPSRWLIALVAGAVLMAACAELQAAVPEVDRLDVAIVAASGPTEVRLLADQGLDVGVVRVTNDLANVCVTYALDAAALAQGWRIHETHLFIGSDASAIPVNRAGNPVPGRFPYGEVDLGGIESWGHCVSFEELGATGTVVVAAHSVIRRHETITPTLSWLRSAEADTMISLGYGAQWPLANGFAIPLDPMQLVWDNGTIHAGAGTFPGLSYASWPHRAQTNGHVDLRRFQASFELPTQYAVLEAKVASKRYPDRIPINDNLYVFLNESLQFWGGTIMGEPLVTYIKVFQAMPGVPVVGHPTDGMGTGGWYIPVSDLTAVSPSAITSGANVLDVFVEEFRQWGGMTELELTLDVLDLSVASESAWGDGDAITAKGSWGTCFTYVPTAETSD
jgi:hypothetical protein